MTYVRGRLDPEGAAALYTALDALMRPPGSDDLRTAAQRRADALVELARLSLSSGDLPTVGGVRPQIGVLITPSMLLTGTGAEPHEDGIHDHKVHDDEVHGAGDACCAAGAREHPPGEAPPTRGDPLEQLGVPRLPELPWMSWIHDVPPALAQRIACDAEVWRAILDPTTGLPLEVGRSHRIVPAWIRKALHARDRGCRWPGCTVPAAWTDAHHLLAWWLGGTTDIDNLLLLCRYHHVKVHEGQWTLDVDRTTGEVRVFRPDGSAYQIAPSRPWSSAGRQADRR
jgi:hypothetical protein